MEKQLILPKEVEMKITHTDLVDYVITKELERLKPGIEATEKLLEDFKKRSNPVDLLLNDAKRQYKKLIDATNPKWYKVVGNRRSMECSDAVCNFMSGGGYYIRRHEDTTLINSQLFVTDQFIVKYTVPDKILKQCADIEKEQIRLKKVISDLKDQYQTVKNGSWLIKAKITEQILSSTIEGKELKERLKEITFTKLLAS